MTSTCKVEQRYVLSNENVRAWVATTQDVGNMTYIKVCKWDRNFVKFCTGKCLDRRKSSRFDIAGGFIDKLAKDHQRACNDAVTNAIRVMEEDDSPSKKHKTAKPSHSTVVEGHVHIHVPSQTLDGVTIDPQTIRVKFDPPQKGKGRKEYMWVELTRANLEYLRMAVVNMGKHEGCDMSRKWYAGKHSKTRVRVEPDAKRRRLPSSDTDGSDDDDEEHQSDNDGSDANDVNDDDDESLSKRSFPALLAGSLASSDS